jgi:hypothetical protein
LLVSELGLVTSKWMNSLVRGITEN